MLFIVVRRHQLTVADSIPNVVITIFPSGRTLVLESTQILTQIFTRNISRRVKNRIRKIGVHVNNV
jgi:hypothetical protein